MSALAFPLTISIGCLFVADCCGLAVLYRCSGCWLLLLPRFLGGLVQLCVSVPVCLLAGLGPIVCILLDLFGCLNLIDCSQIQRRLLHAARDLPDQIRAPVQGVTLFFETSSSAPILAAT